MHKNNFDFLRLLFAIFVVITHSYAISGIPENDLIAQLTGGQTSFSYLGGTGRSPQLSAQTPETEGRRRTA